MRPRLADAKFFFDQDRKTHARVARAGARQGGLSRQAGQPGRARARACGAIARRDRRAHRRRALALAERAALLAKADLLTDMVGEFPELQGIMGGYYARHDGEPAEVALAIREHYATALRGRRDKPHNLVGEALALADSVETLVGIWGIGLQAHRRQGPVRAAPPRAQADPICSSVPVRARRSSRCGSSARSAARGGARPSPIALNADTVAEVEPSSTSATLQQLAAAFDARAVDAVIGPRPPLHDVARPPARGARVPGACPRRRRSRRRTSASATS